MTDRLVPPEFQIRETQVMTFEEPNPDVFYPNNQGATGWSPLPPKLDRQVGMDPSMRFGADPAAAAAQSGSEAVANLLGQTSVNQIKTTRVTDHEGGSYVTYHEPTRDDQTSSVGGRSVTGDPQTVQQALLVGDRPTERAPTVDAYQAGGAVNRQTAGMNEGTKMAFLDMIRQKGGEAIESVSSGLSEAIGTRVVKSTDSGVPWYDQLHGNNPALIELKEIMRYHGERQRKGAAKPMAQYHPSQSNYQSRNGSFGSINPLNVITKPLTYVKGAVSDAIDTNQLTSQVQPSPYGTKALYAAKDSFLVRSLSNQQGTAPATGVEAYNTSLVGKHVLNRAGTPAPTAGNGNEDSTAYIGEDGIAYYEESPTLDFDKAGMSKNVKIGLAVAAGIGLLLLLK
jgi:hypothetical protein